MKLEAEQEREGEEAQDEKRQEVAERVVVVENQTRDWAAARGTTRQGMLLQTQQPSGFCHFASPCMTGRFHTPSYTALAATVRCVEAVLTTCSKSCPRAANMLPSIVNLRQIRPHCAKAQPSGAKGTHKMLQIATLEAKNALPNICVRTTPERSELHFEKRKRQIASEKEGVNGKCAESPRGGCGPHRALRTSIKSQVVEDFPANVGNSRQSRLKGGFGSKNGVGITHIGS